MAAQPLPPPAAPPVANRASLALALPLAPPLPDPSQRTSLYVGDLHPEVTEEDLLTLFSRVGPVSSVHLCRDRLSHNSLCYAYVNFKSHSDGKQNTNMYIYTYIHMIRHFCFRTLFFVMWIFWSNQEHGFLSVYC